VVSRIAFPSLKCQLNQGHLQERITQHLVFDPKMTQLFLTSVNALASAGNTAKIVQAIAP
jgi:hypothetical protein